MALLFTDVTRNSHVLHWNFSIPRATSYSVNSQATVFVVDEFVNKKSYNILKCDNGRYCWMGWMGSLYVSETDLCLFGRKDFSVIVLSKNKFTSPQKSDDIWLIHKRLL